MPSTKAESMNCRSALSDRKLVPDEQVKIFCEVLHFRREYGENYATEDGRSIYKNRLRPLLPKLKYPLSNDPGFAMKLILPKQSDYCHLCDLHKGLNADFVHQWFKFLALEVGARLEILRESNSHHVGDYAWNDVIRPLTRLHKIWEPQERIEEAFGNFLRIGGNAVNDLIAAERQKDSCEACVLARIGSHGPTLFALRAVVKSRISLESSAKHPSRLRLLRLIEPWIEFWQARQNSHGVRHDTREETMLANTVLADQLYIQRKEMEIYKHQMKRQGQKNKSFEEDATDSIFHDAENDIIDSYAALRATQRQSQLLKSLSVDQEERKVATPFQGERNQPKHKVDPAYRESRYSIDTTRNNARVIQGRSTAFTDLPPPRRPQTDAGSVQTCWNDIIAGGGGIGNPFVTQNAPTNTCQETYRPYIPSQPRGVHKIVRDSTPQSDRGLSRPDSVLSYKTPNSHEMFDCNHLTDKKKEHRYSRADEVVSPISRLSLRDSIATQSVVSSVYTDEECSDD